MKIIAVKTYYLFRRDGERFTGSRTINGRCKDNNRMLLRINKDYLSGQEDSWTLLGWELIKPDVLYIRMNHGTNYRM